MSSIKYLSTTKLSQKLKITKQELDNFLLAKQYISKVNNQIIITALGQSCGGAYLTHEKYGQYIAWPEDIKLDMSLQNHYSATIIGQECNLSARKINMILSELGWIQRYIKGWQITDLGLKNGGVQKENSQNGIPYVEWPKSILDNNVFKAIIKEVQGNNSSEVTESINNENSQYDFRSKFEAKHRATDGHFVRSKAEMLIDNWLYMAEIVHAYERKLPIEEEVYCDFYIPTGKVYIEFWGLENDSKYETRKQAKKAIYEKYGFKLIELTDEDVFNLDDVLPKMLLKFGVQTY
jgi:hypothetical protein